MNSSLRLSRLAVCLGLVIAAAPSPAPAQSMKLAASDASNDGSNDSAAGRTASADIAAKPVVPRLIKYSGALRDAQSAPRVGTVGVVFALYSEPTGGAPLWQETQNVQLDDHGRYAVLLGAGRALPKDIFTSTEARWLGVQVMADAEPEQARVLLVSVPYALKAQDAETLGGRPASAYMLNDALGSVGPVSKGKISGGQAAGVDPEGQVQTGTYTLNAIPKFTTADTLVDSMMFEVYNQSAVDSYGQVIPGNEDVLRIGDGTGLRKALKVAGRVVSEGFDINTAALNSVRIVNTHATGTALQTNNFSTSTGFSRGVYASAQSSNAVGIQAFILPPTAPSVPGTDYTYAVVGMNQNPEGVGLLGWQLYNGAGGDTLPPLTGPVGVFGSVAHSSGTAGIFAYRGTGTGKIFSGLAGTTEVIGMTSAGNITAAGDIAANAFVGDGSGLTNVAADSATNVTGTVALANGGTGLTASGASGNFLRSNGTIWTSSAIQPSDLPALSGDFVDLTSNQTIAGTKTFTTGIDASAAPATLPIQAGAVFPATCVGNKELFIKIGGFSAGQQVFLCDVSGTSWNQVGDGLGNNNNLSFNPVTIPANTVNLVKNTCTEPYSGVYPANAAGQDIPIPPATGSLSATSTLVASVLSSMPNRMPAAWDSYTFQAYVDSSGVQSFLHVCNFTLTSFVTSGAITFNVRAIN